MGFARPARYPKLQGVLKPAKMGTMVNNLQRAVVLERLTEWLGIGHTYMEHIQ